MMLLQHQILLVLREMEKLSIHGKIVRSKVLKGGKQIVMKSNFQEFILKKVTECMLVMTLIITGLWIQPKEANAAEDVTVVTALAQSYVEQREVSGYIGVKAPKPITEEYEHWLFAGWYEDEACTSTPITDTSYTGKYYAKYVPEEVLSVKCQVASGTAASTETTKLRLVSSVDTLEYNKVGFVVEIDDINYCYVNESKEVYSTIVAAEDGVTYNYTPTVFQYTASKYFITATVAGIPSTAYGSGIRVTPYWKTLDGTTVEGVSRCVRVEDSYLEIVNVPVRVYSDTTAKSGNSFTVSYDSEIYDYTGFDKGTLTGKVTVDSTTTPGEITCTLGENIEANGMLGNLRFTKKDTAQSVVTEGFGISSETVTDWNSSYDVHNNLQLAVRDGNLSRDILYNHGTPIYSNANKKTQTKLESGVKYTYAAQNTGGLKSVYVENLALDTADFSKMIVRIRSLSTDSNGSPTGFTRWRLYLNPNASISTVSAGTMIVDTGSISAGAGTFDSTVNQVKTTGVVSITDVDTEGWITVIIDLKSIASWVNADHITGINLGYLNTGAEQEISDIQFVKTDGVISSETLYDLGTAYHSNSSEAAVETLQNTGVRYSFLDYSHAGLRTVYVESLRLDANQYHAMTFRIRSLSADANGNTYGFTRWRLYINPDSSASTSKDRAGTLIVDTGDNACNPNAVTVSAADADGWITVTIDLNGVAKWTSAGEISGINIGYLNTGVQQEISDIRFVKKADGDFSANCLYQYGTPVYNNGTTKTEYPQYKSLLSTGVKYAYSATAHVGGNKGVDVNNVELQTCKYDTMTIRLRSLDGNSFVRYILSLETNVNGALTEVLNIDSVGNELLMENGLDANGWYTVTIDLSGITEWTEAETLTGFNFSYINYGAIQEIAEIQFLKTRGDFSADTLYELGTPIHNHKTVAKKELLSTGVQYTFDNTHGAAALKAVHVKDLDLVSGRYDTMTIKIRDVDNNTFSRYRLYLVTDKGGGLTSDPVIDSASTNASLMTTSSADANGWITLTIDLGGLTAWTDASVVTAFALGYVNAGYVQEIGEIQFTAEEEVKLVYNSSDYMSKRYAYRLSTEVEGLENTSFATTASGRIINVMEDTTLSDGTAIISVSGTSTTCKVADYYGFEAVLDYFKAHGHIMTDGASVSLDYKNNISGIEASNQYAYNKSGENRVMFYNVLWNSSVYVDDVLTTIANSEQRDIMQAEVIEQYMPDVLGLQERNNTRSGLGTYLTALGYQEVDVASEVNKAGLSINNVPLLYNTETMTVIADGFMLYATSSETSKGLTWAVLQSKATSDKVLVINTHIVAGNSSQNYLQAQELEAEISKLRASYNGMPIIVGGDYNATASETASYQYLKNTMGYTDAALNASEKSVVRAHHGYPVNTAMSSMDLTNLLTPNEKVLITSSNGSNSVDHIMLDSLENVTLKVYGVVVDNCTESAGDHFPVFIDFDVEGSGSDSGEAGTTKPTILTLSANNLYTYGTPVWAKSQANYNSNANVVTAKTQVTDSDTLQYVFTGTTNALRGLYVDLSDTTFDLTKYTTITFKLKFHTGTSLNHCRLYFKVDNGTGVLASNTYTNILSSSSTQDADGWITVTVDLSKISGWATATKIDELYIGYVPSTYATTGGTQEISAIVFSK